MVVITVAGTAQRFVPAQRGTARIRATLESRRSADVLPGVTDLHARLTADAERHVESGAATWWSADQVHVAGVHRYVKDSDVTELFHVASAGVAVTFTDFEALSAWVAGVGAVDGVVVDGIAWALTEEHRAEVEKEVRTEAVRDAQERATAYAAALGLETVTVTALYEPGLRPYAPRDLDGGAPMYARMASSQMADGTPFSLRPEEIDVSAAITADFTAS